MSAVPAADLRRACGDVSEFMTAPQWDVRVFCRFLARRLPHDGDLDATEIARLAEELIGDLKQGIDRQSGQPFETPMLNDRADLMYNFFRHQLVAACHGVADGSFADAVRDALQFVEPPPKPEEKPAPAAAGGGTGSAPDDGKPTKAASATEATKPAATEPEG